MSTILVADDHPVSLELTREILISRGFAVVTAEDGRRVLNKIDSVRPDLLILDIQMPVLDGYQVVAQLRSMEKWSSLPIIATSASAMTADKENALANGFDAYLEKPYDIEELMATVISLTPRGDSKLRPL